MNLSSKSFGADINFGTAIGSLSNNINYNNKPKHHSIYCSKLVVEREGENTSLKFGEYSIIIAIFTHCLSNKKGIEAQVIEIVQNCL